MDLIVRPRIYYPGSRAVGLSHNHLTLLRRCKGSHQPHMQDRCDRAPVRLSVGKQATVDKFADPKPSTLSWAFSNPQIQDLDDRRGQAQRAEGTCQVPQDLVAVRPEVDVPAPCLWCVVQWAGLNPKGFYDRW